ncbi:MAG: hypothetical protein M3410_05115 [Acidobacteriota bacterium]|nr:hypothetical protein [Acidobacteriota bacterium]
MSTDFYATPALAPAFGEATKVRRTVQVTLSDAQIEADNLVRVNVREKLPNTWKPKGIAIRRFVKPKSGERVSC